MAKKGDEFNENVFGLGVICQVVGFTGLLLAAGSLCNSFDGLVTENYILWLKWRIVFMTASPVSLILIVIGRKMSANLFTE